MVSPAMLMITQNCFPSDADHSQLYRFARDLHPHTEASKFVSAKLVTTHICTFCKTPTPPLETTSPSQQNRKTVNLIITLNFLYLSQEIQIPSRDPEFILAKLMITRTWTFCKGPTSPTKTASPSQLKSKTTNLLITHNFTFYHIPSSHGTWISAKLITRTCTSHTFLQETRIPYRRLQICLHRADCKSTSTELTVTCNFSFLQEIQIPAQLASVSQQNWPPTFVPFAGVYPFNSLLKTLFSRFSAINTQAFHVFASCSSISITDELTHAGGLVTL